MEKIYRHILCIDLKSFFASVECIDRGLNPFTTPLVVANKSQGNGAITLAVTPYLKNLGIKGRTRLYEIPKKISYHIISPRMNRYIAVSKQVIQIYLDFVSQEDLHIYSIDECFLDVSDYLSYYKMPDFELAKKILKTVKEKTGLTATCGIGPNLFLAKVAMDIDAKHSKENIAKWTYEDVKTKLWKITPLSKIWGIGSQTEKKLTEWHLETMEKIANESKEILKRKLGIYGEELWYHANGIDDAQIKTFQKEPKEKSFYHSQVLLRDYTKEEITLIIKEMLDTLTLRLRENHLEASSLGLEIRYSKKIGGGFFHSVKLENSYDLTENFYPQCLTILDSFLEKNMPIRKVSISLGNLLKKESVQLNLFETFEEKKRKRTNSNHIR